jgi:hypothetical protein
MFSSSHTTPGMSFMAALRSNTQQQQLLPFAQACLTTVGEMSALLPLRCNQLQVQSQLRQTPSVNILSLNDMFKSIHNSISTDDDRVQWDRVRRR